MIDSTNPRVMADNIKELSALSGSQASDISALQTTVTAQGNAIGALGSYSTDEVDTGMKYGDKTIYRKIFEIESMPNNTSVQIPHGIENLDVCMHLYGIMQTTQGQAGQPIPYGNGLLLRYNWTVIVIQTSSDFSGNSGIVVIEYTKSASPSPDLSLVPDPDTRSLEESEVEEPINEELKKEEK